MKVDAAQVALNYAALRAAADVADHWVQTDHQATRKGWHDGDTERVSGRSAEHSSGEGRKACAAHVASYVALQGVTMVAASSASGRKLSLRWLAAGLALSGVTHYIADRRRPLRAMAEATGKGSFVKLADHGLNGAYLLDQAWHHGFEAVAAVVAAVNSYEK